MLKNFSSQKRSRYVVITIIVIVALLGFIFLPNTTNQAEESLRPMLDQLDALGGKRICYNGDSGRSISNKSPWYQAYYTVPDAATLAESIKAIAASEGYALKEDSVFINDLKGLSRDDGSLVVPYGDERFNPNSDYLIATDKSNILQVTINRDAAVALYCIDGAYGRQQNTSEGSAIVNLQLSLPEISR